MANAKSRVEALRLWEEGSDLHMRNDIDGAIEKYRESITLCPTAEAHTFLGWAFSFRGDIDAAITQCKIAIDVDPDFGNPYNDIGAYLIEQGKPDEAFSWLERAKHAKRYGPRQFPYINLARIYASRGEVTRAIHELEQALEIIPGDSVALQALAKLRSLN
jgi:Tfp pilus assembly protein PilF